MSSTFLPVEDSAGERFYAELREKRLRFPKCNACKKVFVPPRAHCSRCFTKDLAWIDAPKTGTLYAFSYQKVGLRFLRPAVIGAVELQFEDGPARLISNIVGEYKDLSIGLPVELDFVEIEKGVFVHQFKPVQKA